jgi:MFS transporter, ACDE family, multidrug resistance protein
MGRLQFYKSQTLTRLLDAAQNREFQSAFLPDLTFAIPPFATMSSEISSSPFCADRIQPSHRLLVVLIAGSLAVMPGAVIAPVLPEIVQELHLDKALAGYLVSAHFLTVALCSPLLGILADRIGQVRVLVVSLCLFALFGVAGSEATSFWTLLATRALLGAATGGVAAASLGILSRMYPDKQLRSQAIAYATCTLTLANIAYPLLAGLLGSNGWQIAFYLYGLGLPVACLVASTLRSTVGFPADRLTVPPLLPVLRDLQVLRLLLSVGLIAATAYAAIIYLPLYLKATLHTTTLTNGLVLAAHAIGAAVASGIAASQLAKRFGSVGAIAIGLGCVSTAAVLVPQLPELFWFFPVALLFGVGLGIAVPNHYAALANLAPTNLQASVLASATGMNFLGHFFSPLLFGWLLHQGHGSSTVTHATASSAAGGSVAIVFYAVSGVTAAIGLGWIGLSKVAKAKG